VCLWKIIRSGAETFEEAAMDEDDATFMRKVRAPKSDEHKALWDVALEDVRRRFAMHSSDEFRRRFDTFMGMTYDRNRYPQKSPLGVLGVFVRTARRDPVRAAVTLCDPYIHMHQAGIRVALEDKERQKRVALYLERVEKRMQNGDVLLGCNVIAVDQLEKDLPKLKVVIEGASAQARVEGGARYDLVHIGGHWYISCRDIVFIAD
jgi:hypothetical protein